MFIDGVNVNASVKKPSIRRHMAIGGGSRATCDFTTHDRTGGGYRPTVDKVVEALNRKGRSIRSSRVLVLGLAYKKDIDDVRESPSLKLITLVQKRGARVDYNDPFVPRTHKMREYDLRMALTPARRRRDAQAHADVKW